MPLRYADLREFLQYLEGRDQLRRIDVSVSPVLEMTEISDRVLRQGGPALLFRNPEAEGRRWHFPVLTNLFGTPDRVALGMGVDSVAALREGPGAVVLFLATGGSKVPPAEAEVEAEGSEDSDAQTAQVSGAQPEQKA